MADAVEIAYLEALDEQEQAFQRQVVAARKYHMGEHNVKLTDRLKQFLGKDFNGFEFRMNVVQSVSRSVVEKLGIIGFDSEDPDLIEWAQKVWGVNNMDAVQDDIYDAALCDGAHYVIVDWPVDGEYPRWLPQQYYTSTEVGGDGLGCFIRYEQDDPNLDPIVGVKIWTDKIDDKQVQRRTLYFPDRIEKYARTGSGGDWQPIMDEGDSAWPIPWVDVDGNPLGVAVIPFYNKWMIPEASDAYPLQDAVNKLVVDLLSTEDQTAYRILVALGFIPTKDGLELKSDGSNALEIEPGVVVGTTKSKTEASFGAIDPPELAPLMDLVQQMILWLAFVTDTPVNRYITTKLIASDQTLKQQEMPLIAKVENRQKLFGRGFKMCFDMSIKLAALYGDEAFQEGESVEVLWKSAQSLMDRLEELQLKKDLGVPPEQIWAEIGYDKEKIASWLANQAQNEPTSETEDIDINEDQDE
jgi:hypothetical protein